MSDVFVIIQQTALQVLVPITITVTIFVIINIKSVQIHICNTMNAVQFLYFCYRFSYGAKVVKNVSGVVFAYLRWSFNWRSPFEHSQRPRAATNTGHFFSLHVTANYFRRWIFYAKQIIFRPSWHYSAVCCSRHRIQYLNNR